MFASLRRGLPLWSAAMVVWSALWLAAGPPISSLEQHRLDLALRLGEHGQLLLVAQSLGFELLILPAALIGGETLVRLWLMALTALAVPLSAALARRLVPAPWPTRAALALIVAAPMVGGGGAIAPEGVAATMLVATALLVLRVGDSPRTSTAAGGALILGLLPWLAIKLLAPMAALAATLWLKLRASDRKSAALVVLEIVVLCCLLFATLSDRLFGTLLPVTLAADGATGASGLIEYLQRAPRLVTSLADPSFGLLVWWPPAVLIGGAVWLLVRSRRDLLGHTLPQQVAVEKAVLLLLIVVGAVWLTAVFFAPSLEPQADTWARSRQLLPLLPVAAALSAWVWRRLPRTGNLLAVAAAVLSALLVTGVI